MGTGAPLKNVFDTAAEAVMQPPAVVPSSSHATRNRKAGGRGVRISGYVSTEMDEALRDEVVKRTNAERRSVSFNDVLCSIIADWIERRKVTP